MIVKFDVGSILSDWAGKQVGVTPGSPDNALVSHAHSGVFPTPIQALPGDGLSKRLQEHAIAFRSHSRLAASTRGK
ncbi:MAG: hypothetical protein WCK15_03235 [Pirellula sp.]